jgi:hypothetical protein
MDRNMKMFILLVATAAVLGCSRIEEARGDKTVCPIRGVRWQEDLVPIRYGTPAEDDWTHAYNSAWFANFQYSFTWLGGGCVSGTFGDKARVRYCPKCRETEAAWLREHPYKRN